MFILNSEFGSWAYRDVAHKLYRISMNDSCRLNFVQILIHTLAEHAQRHRNQRIRACVSDVCRQMGRERDRDRQRRLSYLAEVTALY